MTKQNMARMVSLLPLFSLLAACGSAATDLEASPDGQDETAEVEDEPAVLDGSEDAPADSPELGTTSQALSLPAWLAFKQADNPRSVLLAYGFAGFGFDARALDREAIVGSSCPAGFRPSPPVYVEGPGCGVGFVNPADPTDCRAKITLHTNPFSGGQCEYGIFTEPMP